MQQTIYGETRKKKLYERNVVDEFLSSNLEIFESFRKNSLCIYSEDFLSSDQAVNYLNHNSGKNTDQQLKSLIGREFVECEKIYPYLGDIFLYSYFFENKFLDFKNRYIFTKETADQFLSTLSFDYTKEIFTKLIQYINLQYSVSLEKSVLNEIFVEKNDTLNFNLDYDSSFLGNKSFHTMKEYKFIIIDGYVESVGEVHHLFEKASKTKIPHVIFCFGMSSEVDHVIKVNNTSGNFEIFPVVIKFDENSINVLSDIAVMHNSSVVSSKLGQTISQSVSKELETGKEITFSRKGFKIVPLADSRSLDLHVRFLNRRISEAKNKENRNLLTARLKNFKSKHVKIYLPESIFNQNDILRDFDYMLRFFNFCKCVFLKVDYSSNRSVYIPEDYLKIVDKKVKSLKSILAEIDGMVLHARD